MSDPQDTIADYVSDLYETNHDCKQLHTKMLQCIKNRNGTMKCHDLIDKWHDCRTKEKELIQSFYKFSTNMNTTISKISKSQ